RRIMSQREREQSSAAICQHLIDVVTGLGARSISAYLPANDEPNIRPFLNWAEAEGIRVLFPVSRDDGLLDWVAGDGENEQIGLFGMPEASGDLLSPLAINDVDLIVVPAASI